MNINKIFCVKCILCYNKVMTILDKVYKLKALYKEGALGGEVMPEDSNPDLPLDSEQNYIYFTLPMALNYQRNSYVLWQQALKTYQDKNTFDVFNPRSVIAMPEQELREKLTKYKVALQPNKQPVIWHKLCETLCRDFDGSIKTFFQKFDYNIFQIKEYIMSHKKDFPYLSGDKILNYWLYVMTEYTSGIFSHRESITIAPDTHVLQASIKLGIIQEKDLTRSDIRVYTSEKWSALLAGTDLVPIDMHTPLWLWSRNGFKVDV